MSLAFPELDQVRVSVSEETRSRHLAHVGAALRARSDRLPRRGRVLALALALVLLVPVMALAAENAVPGDLLYPVKRAVEPVVSIFDADAPAERRVREVEVLFDRNVPDEVVVRHIDIARETVADHPAPHLTDRIDFIEVELDARRARHEGAAGHKEKVGDKPREDRPADGKPVPPAVDDQTSTTHAPTTTHDSSPDSTHGDTGDRGDGGRDG